jgi:hypothetical protein
LYDVFLVFFPIEQEGRAPTGYINKGIIPETTMSSSVQKEKEKRNKHTINKQKKHEAKDQTAAPGCSYRLRSSIQADIEGSRAGFALCSSRVKLFFELAFAVIH